LASPLIFIPIILWKPTPTVQRTFPSPQEWKHRSIIPPIVNNKKQPQSPQEEHISATTTLDENKESFSYQQPLSPSFEEEKHPLNKKKKHVEYHLVFSSGCSPYQNWQSYAFFYHAHKSGQPGNITRIVSGCSPKQRKKLQQVHQMTVQTISSRFHIHFTPEYSRIKPGVKYKYFNKPFGMKHWMEHALGYPHNTTTETTGENAAQVNHSSAVWIREQMDHGSQLISFASQRYSKKRISLVDIAYQNSGQIRGWATLFSNRT
jgi:hypothetical protein